jgi:hypothetical protein
MSKTEILLDWLSKQENRETLPYADVKEAQYDVFEHYGQIYSYPDTDVVYLGKTFFRIKNKGK